MRRVRSVSHLLVALLAAAAPAAPPGAALAQIVTDGALGPRTTLGGRTPVIDAALGARRGANLFHSFERFGVRRGQVATFEAPPGVGRVIARVTGGRESRIDGALGASAPVDLVLLNPAGLALGRGGRIETGGSLILSTADALIFADGTRLAVSDPAPALSVAEPADFGFGPGRDARIRVEGGALRSGADLFVVADDVALRDATLEAAAVATTRDRGLIVIARDDLSIADSAVTLRGAQVLLSAETARIADSRLESDLIRITAGRAQVLAGGEPVLDLLAGRLTLEGEALLDARDARAVDPAARLAIFARDLTVEAEAFAARRALVSGSVTEPSAFVFSVGRLDLLDGSVLLLTGGFGVSAGLVRLVDSQIQIDETAADSGNAAVLRAGEIRMRGSDIVVFGERFENGAVAIRADRIVVEDGAIGFVSRGRDGGFLFVRADDYLLLDDAALLAEGFEAGDAGGVAVEGGFLVMRNGAFVGANADAGDAGIVGVEDVTLVREPGTAVEAVSRGGADGLVLTGDAVADARTERRELPSGFFDAFALIDDACAAAVAGGSALVRDGRGGAPFTGAAQPALFGGALAYPSGAATAPPPVAAADAPGGPPCPLY